METAQTVYALSRSGGPVVGEASARFAWWSIAKTVLAVAILKLAEGEALSIDDRFDDRPFTIKQLLQHSSGLTTYGGSSYHTAVANGDPVWSVDALLERYDTHELLFPPADG